MKKLFLTLIMFIQLGLLFARQSLDITYIANEGFLISSESTKILIDGIFTQGWGNYHTPTAAVLKQERKALSPFDDIKFLLVSHSHADHINPDYVAEHMVNDTMSILICPAQVNDLLKSLTAYNAIQDRIQLFTPAHNTQIDTLIHNFMFKIVALPHNDDDSNSIQNLGCILNFNGFKIFHPGDGNSININDYQNKSIKEDSIDIAFFPYWFFDSENSNKRKDIINYINPKAIIIMHVNKNTYNDYKNKVQNIHDIPPVFFMESPMEKLFFFKEGDSLLTSPTGIQDKKGALPENSRLYQNYPNPFNPTTSINYQLAVEGNVKLQIYDTLGRQIKTLVDSCQREGEHIIVWNGTDNFNNPVTTGIYIFSLCANELYQQKKMLLIR